MKSRSLDPGTSNGDRCRRLANRLFRVRPATIFLFVGIIGIAWAACITWSLAALQDKKLDETALLSRIADVRTCLAAEEAILRGWTRSVFDPALDRAGGDSSGNVAPGSDDAAKNPPVAAVRPATMDPTIKQLAGDLYRQCDRTEDAFGLVIAAADRLVDPSEPERPVSRAIMSIHLAHGQFALETRSLWRLQEEGRVRDARTVATGALASLDDVIKQSEQLSQSRWNVFRYELQNAQRQTGTAVWMLLASLASGIAGFVLAIGVRFPRKATSSKDEGNMVPLADAESLSPGDGPAADLSGCHVLVAEDGADDRCMMAVGLAKCGARVGCAADGQQALEMATLADMTGTRFDAILMDYEMPIMDGVAATKKLREAGFSGKIIFATTRDGADIRSAAAKAGCDAFIANPLDWRNVSHVVALHVRSKNENAAALTA